MRTGKTARTILNRAFERHIGSMAELGGRMGWSGPTTSKMLNNPELMRLKDAKRLCALTGFTLEELSKM